MNANKLIVFWCEWTQSGDELSAKCVATILQLNAVLYPSFRKHYGHVLYAYDIVCVLCTMLYVVNILLAQRRRRFE